ncbi:glycosyltransferase family 8 protein [Phlebopus sp. FC_14]|nr:glycosyltransferase family 8 protein [Phlebopus sp. FC_14]
MYLLDVWMNHHTWHSTHLLRVECSQYPSLPPGVLVLEYSLRSVDSAYPVVVMVTPALPDDVRDILTRRGISMGLHTWPSHDARFADTWTKLRHMDELMELTLPKNHIAAAHVCACNPRKLPQYPADCLVVLNPSAEPQMLFTIIFTRPPLIPTWSFSDQDLLSDFFKAGWQPLPWCYNVLKTLMLIHKPLWRDEEIRCLRYILADKPWQARVPENGKGNYGRRWWNGLAQLDTEMQESNEDWKVILANVVPE